jgi:hypothetical protein
MRKLRMRAVEGAVGGIVDEPWVGCLARMTVRETFVYFIPMQRSRWLRTFGTRTRQETRQRLVQCECSGNARTHHCFGYGRTMVN